MKKLLTSVFTLTMALVLNSQNSLLNTSVTEALPTTWQISKIKVIDNGLHAALVVAAYNGDHYIIDINDNDPNDKTDNAITTYEDITEDIEAMSGYEVDIIQDITVNPISHSVYICVLHNNYDSYSLFKLSDGNLQEINNTQTFSKINAVNIAGLPIDPWGLQDITWGSNILYSSTEHNNGSFNGVLSRISAPFTHNSTISEYNRTSCHTHDSGSGEGYFTNAPLQKLAFGNIDGNDRILGTFTCAPGYSCEPTELSWDGTTEEIKEMWNADTGRTLGLAFQTQNGNPYLFELHGGMGNNDLIRIGKSFIDGSPEGRDEVNSDRVYLRTNWGTEVNPDLTTEQVEIASVPYSQMEKWSECEVLYVEYIMGGFGESDTYNLIVTETASCSLLSNKKVKKDNLSVNLNYNKKNRALEVSLHSKSAFNHKSEILIYNLTGNLVLRQDLTSNTTIVKTNNLKRGTYITVINSNNENKLTSKVFIK
jgi:hypothetical protein